MNGRNDGHAEGRGRVYQSSGDQHIVEHHHHGGHGPAVPGPDSVRRPPVGRAPVVLRDRAELMDRLRAAVTPEAGGQVYVLHGLGGCGKTAVAYALFEYATAEAGQLGLWVNASDAASLRAGMLSVAADRGARQGELTAAHSGLRAAADLVWHHLDQSDRPWLLVLDNADDPSVLRDGGWLRTSARGTVLVTTRQAAARWWPGAELLHVGVLPRADAAKVLCDLAPEAGTAEEAAEVADRLGRLPLALTLAGGFLAQQVISPWTMSMYNRHLDGDQGLDPIELIDQGAAPVADGDSRHLVSGTWQISLNALRDQGLPEATSLLRLLACWSGDVLPLSLLSGADLGTDLPVHRVEPALRGLLDQSLTQVVPDGTRCLRTHGVLLDSVARGTPAEQHETIVAAATRLLTTALPELPHLPEQSGQSGTVEQNSRAGVLAPHALALLRRAVGWKAVEQPTVEAATVCSLRLVDVLYEAGGYGPALTLARQTSELGRQRLGDEHPLVVRLRRRTGQALFRLGRFDEAATLLRQVLAACERLHGAAAEDTLESCLALSNPLVQLGRAAESAALMRRAVIGRSEVLGPTHPLTLRARTYLLEIAPETEPDEGTAAGPALIEDCHRELGPDHRFTLFAEHAYARALAHVGRPAEALPLTRKVLTGYERLHGPEYPLTLGARSLLGHALAAMGEYAEAVEHAEAVLRGRTEVLGATHPWTGVAQERLAQYRSAQ